MNIAPNYPHLHIRHNPRDKYFDPASLSITTDRDASAFRSAAATLGCDDAAKKTVFFAAFSLSMRHNRILPTA
ncbi:MAG: hypothetical protein ACYC26_15825 [Phycisphaerales bacterium]